MQKISEWEDLERDKLARYLVENTTVIERQQWLNGCYFPELATDIAQRIKDQPLEREADRYIQRSTRQQIEQWLEAMGYEEDRQAWRQRLNRARLRVKEQREQQEDAA